MSQKIVGNFVVGSVFASNEIGQWTGYYLVRRYGVNNGRIIAMKAAPGLYPDCHEASGEAMRLGEEFARNLDPDSGTTSHPSPGDELFIPPSAGPMLVEGVDAND